MFQSIKYEDKREVFGFKVHSFSTFEKIKKYDETDNVESAEKPYSIEVGRTKRTINLYLLSFTCGQVICFSYSKLPTYFLFKWAVYY